MRYAVIGAAGQLGRDLCPRLPGQVIPLGRAEADLTNPVLLRQTLSALKPDVVVNCAAYNFVDQAESEPDAAIAVNDRGVRSLARLCKELDSVLVHFSTDYVFGQESARTTPYQVTDAPGPLSAYGRSKLAGEDAVRTECPGHFVIRTCGLYGSRGAGGKGGNFVETMLRLAGQGQPLRVVNDQICTPSYIADVAVATIELIQTGRYGLYHVTSAGSCSWHEFARAIFDVGRVRADLSPVPSRDYPTPARRPNYSVLALDELSTAGVTTPRPWDDALAAFFVERKAKR